MTKQDYLKLLVEGIHSTTIATIGADSHPQTRVIDMMLWDENGVYFLTAKGKGVLRPTDGAGLHRPVRHKGQNFDLPAGENQKHRQREAG